MNIVGKNTGIVRKKHIILVGDFGSGKSSVLYRLINKEFTNNFNTVTLDFQSYLYQDNDKIMKVFVWDSLGYERFQSTSNDFYKKAQGIVLVFDLTEAECSDIVLRWLHIVETRCDPDIPIIIVGNKCDICSSVDRKLREVSCVLPVNLNLVDITKCSAKTGENIEEVFRAVITKMYANELNNRTPNSSIFSKRSNDLTDGPKQYLNEKVDENRCCQIL